MAEHTPARILQVRAKLYDLLSHCIPPTTILKVNGKDALYSTHFMRTDSLQTLTFKLIPKIDDALKGDVVKWSAFYEHRIKMGSVSHSVESHMPSSTEDPFLETHLPSRSLRSEIHEDIREVSYRDVATTKIFVLTNYQLSNGNGFLTGGIMHV